MKRDEREQAMRDERRSTWLAACAAIEARKVAMAAYDAACLREREALDAYEAACWAVADLVEVRD